MKPKILLFLILIPLLSIVAFTNDDEDEIDPYFEGYMERKFKFLKAENSTRSDALCFQTSFPVGNLDNSYFAFDGWVGTENKEEQIYRERSDKKLVDRYPKPPIIGITCSSRFVEYFLNYKFPEGYEEGAEIDDMDVKILVQKKLFHFGYPETCKDVKTFTEVFLRENEMVQFVTNVQELDDGRSYILTIEDCYPQVKMKTFMQTFSVEKLKKNFEKKDKLLRYYASTDSQKDYFQWYLERKSVLLKPEDSPMEKSLCFRSKFPMQSQTYMGYIFGKYGEEQMEREMKWFEKRLREKLPAKFDANHTCLTNPIQYTTNYELPLGADSGNVELDALDVKIMKHREYYYKNLPKSCEDVMLFAETSAQIPVQRFIRQMVFRRDENDYFVTLDTCYPIVDLNNIEFPEPKKHKSNKYLLNDDDFLEKLMLIEIEVNHNTTRKILNDNLRKLEL